MSSNLIPDAVETESPTPVPIATYAAKHNGHLGNSARIAPGTIHRAMPKRRRAGVGGAYVLQHSIGFMVEKKKPRSLPLAVLTRSTLKREL